MVDVLQQRRILLLKLDCLIRAVAIWTDAMLLSIELQAGPADVDTGAAHVD